MNENQGYKLVDSLQPGQVEDQTILVSANPTNSSPIAGDIIPVLMQGGVAVAVILAMSYFCNILLKSMAQLIKDANQKHK